MQNSHQYCYFLVARKFLNKRRTGTDVRMMELSEIHCAEILTRSDGLHAAMNAEGGCESVERSAISAYWAVGTGHCHSLLRLV